VNLYLLELKENTPWDYDDIISCVVRAPDAEAARKFAAAWMEDNDAGPTPEELSNQYREERWSDCTLVEPDGKREMIHYYRRHG